MNESKSMWMWVGVAVVVILVILALWSWNASSMPGVGSGIGSTTADTSTSPVAVQARPTSTVAAIVAGLSDGTRFASMLASTGVSAEISGKGPFTIFVPTDGAFARLPAGNLNLTAAQMKRLVEYHIIAGKDINVNIQQAGTVQALSKDVLNFSIQPTDKSARVNSSVVTQAFKASNGTVYTINTVLLPPLPGQNQ